MEHRCGKKHFEKTEIVSHEYAGADCYCLTVRLPRKMEGVDLPRAGQFYMISLHDKSHILPRPISLHSFDKEQGTLSFVYRPIGAGTQELTQYRAGENLAIQGPLGNGFIVPSAGHCHIIAGGGIGLAPLPELIRAIRSKQPEARIIFFAGGRDRHIQELIDFFALPADIELILCTDDGSLGIHGFVPDVLSTYIEKHRGSGASSADIAMIYACGPTAMLNKIRAFAQSAQLPCQLSLERRMACGVRACMGCSIQTAAGVKKVCADGPVFDSLLFPHELP